MSSVFQKMAEAETRLTADRLRELLDYDQGTGIFRWKVYRGSKAKAGDVAGSLNEDGYRIILVDGRKYRAHRLAWLWVHGKFPDGIIDHRNCARADNPIDNLRDTTKTVNQQNQRAAFKNNRLGIRGVRLNRTGTGYETRLCVNKKFICLGTYKTAEEAHAVYVAAKRKHHEGCTL